MNDLLVVDNIKTDFCFYTVFRAVTRDSIPQYKRESCERILVQNRSIFRAEYDYELLRQQQICNSLGINVLSVRDTINMLVQRRIIPVKFELIRTEVSKSKKLRRDMKFMMNENMLIMYRGSKLYRYKCPASIISYLLQSNILEYQYMTHEERWLVKQSIEFFRALDTNSASSITFDQSVDNLFNKMMEVYKNG